MKTADESEKSIVGSRGRKPAEKTLKSPKSNLGKRGGPLKTKQNKINHILLICFTITFPLSSVPFKIVTGSHQVSRGTSPASDESDRDHVTRGVRSGRKGSFWRSSFLIIRVPI